MKMIEEEVRKPPIGIEPEEFHTERRMKDLSEAINRYMSAGFFSDKYASKVQGWCDELHRRLEEYK